MASIITEKFRLASADAFKDSFSTDKYYVFIGKSQSWVSEGSTSDTAIPNPVDSIKPEFLYHDDMLGAKLAGEGQTSFVTPRKNWSETTSYDMYRPDISGSVTSGSYPTKTTSSSGKNNLYNSDYYFATSANRVYKVLYNGDPTQVGSSAIGGTEPESTSSTPFWNSTQTHYLKFMYDVDDLTNSSNFYVTDFMPVANITSGAVSTNNSVADGAIHVFNVTNAGTNYPNGTYYVPVRGDGTTTAIIKLIVSGTSVQAFGPTDGTNSQMFNVGVGYRHASVDLSSTNIYTNSSLTTLISGSTKTNWEAVSSAASITPMVEPKGGHGFDTIKELGGHYVMVYQSFAPADTDITQVNDFRRIGLIRNPNNSAGTVLTDSSARATSAILLSGSITTQYQPDEIITQTNGANESARGRVVEFDATNKLLFYVQENYSSYGLDANGDLNNFSGSGSVIGSTSGASYDVDTTSTSTVGTTSIVSGYGASEIQKDSGDIIYVENRRSIQRATDQTEQVRIVVEF